ncbi:MAG: hypothetical protein SGI99_14295, partial [Pseudomonadota bacterium]|nr:hypothetical protein [Pseudomonadota bacterium]
YDPVGNSWAVLTDIPGGRDHALAVVLGADLFVTGGFANGLGGDQSNAGWRYIETENRWEAVPGLPFNAASGAATLNGYAYWGNDSGDVTQFDPRLRRARVINSHLTGGARDHSQLVAFMGELWMLGGRSVVTGETGRASVFDPASETWREGPALQFPRAGFAAATTTTQIIVSGGEMIINGNFARNETEAIAAGENAWSNLPALPIAMHGLGGVTNGNAFYALGGSTLAGGIRNRGEVQIYRWTP